MKSSWTTVLEYAMVKSGDPDDDLVQINAMAAKGWVVIHPILDNGYTTGWLLARQAP